MKTSQRKWVDTGLGPSNQCHLGFSAADHAHAVTNRLDTRCTSRHRATQRPFETVANREIPRGQVGKESRYRERGNTFISPAIQGSLRLGDGGETTDACGDNRGSGLLISIIFGEPTSLFQSLLSRRNRIEGKGINFFAFFSVNQVVRIEPQVRVLLNGRHQTCNLNRKVCRVKTVYYANAGLTFNQTPPNALNPTP